MLTLAMFPVLFTIYVRLAKIEQREAEKRFGEAYHRYAARTPAFLPRFKRLRAEPLHPASCAAARV